LEAHDHFPPVTWRGVFIRREGPFEPAVYLWPHEAGETRKVADDFAELEEP
jgi:hypothetical protein